MGKDHCLQDAVRRTWSLIRRALAASGEATYRCAVSLSAGTSSARGDELAQLGVELRPLRLEHAALRTQIIEEERKRMLAAHAKNLGLQHLPKGVLSTDADMALFANSE